MSNLRRRLERLSIAGDRTPDIFDTLWDVEDSGVTWTPVGLLHRKSGAFLSWAEHHQRGYALFRWADQPIPTPEKATEWRMMKEAHVGWLDDETGEILSFADEEQIRASGKVMRAWQMVKSKHEQLDEESSQPD